jgi:outer membrane lipoprotein-sorting protein
MGAVSLLANLVVLLSLSASPAQKPARRAGDLFDELYQRGLAKQRTLKSVRASFTETTVSTLLVKPIVARGTVIAAPPARVRMTYVEPEAKTITMDGRLLVVAWPARGERQQIDIRDMKERIDKYFTSASPDELRKLFEVTAEPDASLRNADRVTMIPKRKQIKQGMERLDLWIDRQLEQMVQMRLSFPGGDQKTIVLHDIVENVPFTDETFQP